MKAVKEKSKICDDNFPDILDINKKEITNEKIVAENFNKCRS